MGITRTIRVNNPDRGASAGAVSACMNALVSSQALQNERGGRAATPRRALLEVVTVTDRPLPA
jgi:hypothetical protein